MEASTLSEIQQIWNEELRLASCDPDQDFFALGGTSLLAMRIATRAQEILNIEVRPMIIFEFPTFAKFTTHLAELMQNSSQTGALSEGLI
jgi:hypothetical protein